MTAALVKSGDVSTGVWLLVAALYLVMLGAWHGRN